MRLWSSRFNEDITTETLNYTQSVDIDERLITSDIWGSLAHVLMLSHQQIISASDGRALADCLVHMLAEAGSGQFKLDKQLEDVHLNIEEVITCF